jgi:hypothetical protein
MNNEEKERYRLKIATSNPFAFITFESRDIEKLNSLRSAISELAKESETINSDSFFKSRLVRASIQKLGYKID